MKKTLRLIPPTSYWKQLAISQEQMRHLHLHNEGQSHRVTKVEHTDACELQCSEEKADTKIVLDASVAANEGAKIIVIRKTDTDFLILLLHHR